MTNKLDYYEVIGVNRDVGKDELKAKYRKMALKYHPDRNPGDKEAEDKFKEAAEAYNVLQDTEKRQIYDQYGHQGLEGRGFSGAGSFDDIFSSFGDIFEGLFGFSEGSRRGDANRTMKGSDLRYDLNLAFMSAVFGTEKEIEIQKNETCKICKGNGCAERTQPETCSNCNGTGKHTQSQGFFTIQTTCPYCRGLGKTISTPCEECRGSGSVQVQKKVSLKIPAGVDSGSRLRLTGEGEPGRNGGRPGDLYVVINVKPHKYFQRNELDILCLIEICFVQATLGDKIKVETLEGEEVLSIPKGTQHGDTFRLKDQGIPSLRTGRRGDQIIQVYIKIPKKVNNKQEKLLREFQKLDEEKLSNKLKNLFKM